MMNYQYYKESTMGHNRYKILKTKIHEEWLRDCPIKIEKSQLLLDTNTNQIILQVKMFNLSNKFIRSVYLEINGFDDAMDPVSKLKEVNYLLVNAMPQSSFGDRQPVLLDSKIANVEIIIRKVVFDDDTVWRNAENNIGIILPKQRPINSNDKYYRQIMNDFSKKGAIPNYWYENAPDYWRCSCGQANNNEHFKCCYCNIEEEWLKKHLNLDYLELANNEFEKSFKMAEELKRKKIKEEEKIQREKERIQKENSRLNAKKKIKVIALSSLAIIVAFIFLYNAFPMNQDYVEAMKYMKKENYRDAISYFEIADGYRNSEKQMKICNYKIAMNYMKNKNYGDAILYFINADDYKNSVDMVKEARYKYALDLWDKGIYSSAKVIFESLDGYKDSNEKLNNAENGK